MYKKRHLSIFFALLVLLVMWVLYGWNYWNGDRDGYELYYYTRDSLSGWGGEFGYGYLNILANKEGLPYQGFQILISLLTLFLMFRYIVKRTSSPLISIVLYAVCFFTLDFVLMRNFLAFAIFLQGMICLLEGKPFGRTKYVLLVMLAATVHQSSLVFLVFAFMPFHRAVRLDRFFLALLLFVFSYVLIRSNLEFPDIIARHFNYYSTSLKSSLANLSVHLASSFLIALVVLGERKSLCKVREASGRDKELIFIFNLNLFSLFFLVLYFESEIFIRLLRIILFFNILHCINSLFLPRKVYLFLVSYLLVFSVYLVYFFLIPVARDAFFPLFENNLLLNYSIF